jgi:membrane-bound metal-dependent hydrolase YbcI (DUF457 family)
MLVGHLAVGLIGKRIEPRVSLSTWMVAVLLADLLIFPFLMAGIEHVDAVPGVTANRIIGRDIGYSHSLLMDVIWATLFAAAYFLRRRYRRGAWLLFAAVLSHWLLDFVSHRPDMPLFPGGQGFGLGLWNSLTASLIVEGGLWVLAIILYVRGTVPVKRAGVYVFWTVIVLLTLVWKGNITAGMDPNPIRAGFGGLVGITLIVAWAYWIDRLRHPKSFPVTAVNAAEIEARA